MHPIPTSATPGEFRPHGSLLTPILELDDLIGMGNEGRSAKKIMNRILSILSVVISLTALGLSIYTFSRLSPEQPSQNEIKVLIQAELDARDRARIAVVAPKAKRIYTDMLGPKFDSDSFTPTTYEELCLFDVLSG